MQYLRAASEAEAVAEYLAGEFESARKGHAVRAALTHLGAAEGIITRPDLSNEEECRLRLHLLGEVRGLPGMYAFPKGGVDWALFEFTSEDLARTWLAEESAWSELTYGTRLGAGAAERIRRGEGGELAWAIESAARHLSAGGSFRPMILLGSLRMLLAVDGNLRLCAYALAGRTNGARCYVGRCRDGGEFFDLLGNVRR